MSYYSRYDKGDWKAICDVCGREYKASLLKQRWDGLMCCSEDWEIRQPQDFVRGVPDFQIVPWTRDEQQDSFILTCTIDNMAAVAGRGVSGCAIAGKYTQPTSDPTLLYDFQAAISGYAVAGLAISGKGVSLSPNY